MKKLKNIIIFLLVILCTVNFLIASEVGTIQGKVIDHANGSPLPGVNVIIDGTTMGAATDGEGDYYIINVTIGVYSVTASMIGYKIVTVENVRVVRDQAVWINFNLEVTAIEGEEVIVTAERPLVEKDVTGKKVVLDAEEIISLPVRNLAELYTLQSGVVQVKSFALGIPGFEDRGIEEIHVRGGRHGETGFMVDGMYLENPLYGGIGKGSHLNQYAVEQVDFQTGFYNAEYGDNMSGLVNNVTRSGGNVFSGAFRYETSEFGQIQDKLRGYNKLAGGFGGPVRIPFLNDRIRFWVSGDQTKEAYRVLKFDDKVFDSDDPANRNNKKNHVNFYDRVQGWRAFGYSDVWDIFGRLDINITDRLKVNYSYWQSDYEAKVFKWWYVYNEDGRNILMMKSNRHAFEWRHQISHKSFYTIRVARFIQDREMKVKNLDSDGDGWPNWFEYKYGSDAYSYDPNDHYTYPSDVDEEENYQPIYTDNRTGWSVGDPMKKWLTPEQYVGWRWQSYSDSSRDYLFDLSSSGALTQEILDSLYYLFYIFEFIEGGDDRYWHESRSTTDEIRIDFQSQLTKRHQLRMGIDLKAHELMFDEVQLPWYQGGYVERFGTGPDEGDSTRWKYGQFDPPKIPKEFSLYVQDKFEVPNRLVLNAGLRIDLVNYKGKAWPDPRKAAINPDSLINSQWFARYSPRLGFSHIITDRSKFIFGYGVYYQNPVYRNVYINSDALSDSSEFFTGLQLLMGNALVTPEAVTTYEFGIKNEFYPGWAYTILGYSKDYNSLLGAEVVRMGPVKYTTFVNYDYGSSRGIEIILEKRKTRSSPYGGQIQYSFSKAKANRADPWEGYRNQDDPLTMPKKEVLQSYDRTHDLLIQLIYDIYEKGGPYVFGFYPLSRTKFSMTTKYLSGAPYTPILSTTNRSGPTNSERMPSIFNTNIALRKYITLGPAKLTLGLIVRNIFNRKNPIDIYPRTGSPDDPGERNVQNVGNGLISDSYYDRPWYFDDLRSIDFFVEMEY